MSRTTIKRTRTVHECCECCKPIEIGSTCHKAAWTYDGEFCHGYIHTECDECVNDMMRAMEMRELMETDDGRMFLHQLLEDYWHLDAWIYIHANYEVVSERLGLDHIIAKLAMEEGLDTDL